MSNQSTDDLVTFTPYVIGESESANPLRAYMQISAEDSAKVNALPKVPNGEPVEVFDVVSQQSYFVRPAACGGRCFCGAEIVRKGNRTNEHF